jgi:hypothetical protein
MGFIKMLGVGTVCTSLRQPQDLQRFDTDVPCVVVNLLRPVPSQSTRQIAGQVRI